MHPSQFLATSQYSNTSVCSFFLFNFAHSRATFFEEQPEVCRISPGNF
ncbi:MAG: hypothetical protein ACI90V_009078, partial [Bacillariaceae sp.]